MAGAAAGILLAGEPLLRAVAARVAVAPRPAGPAGPAVKIIMILINHNYKNV
jgi:hypothetical protein